MSPTVNLAQCGRPPAERQLPDMSACLENRPGSATEESLALAFARFTEVAHSLEHSYRHLQSEVVRLRRELEERNAELARSLDENLRMRDSLYKILETLPCGVLVVDRAGRVKLLNPAAGRLLHMTHPPHRLSQVPAEVRALLEQVRQGPGEWELEIGSEETHSIAASHARLPSPDDESVYTLQDITERKRLAHQRALVQMAGILAHEIRNPLGSLELFAGLLADSESDSERRGWIEHLQAGLRSLAATVNNVLHFHSLPGLELAPTDVGALLGWVCDFLAPLARQANVQLRLCHQLAEVVIPADRHRLEQVLLNLVINALRVVPSGGSVLVSGEMYSDGRRAFAEIRIADNGPGIAPEHLERIFDAGYTTHGGSPGLGLTVAKTIVEQHGGSIQAMNQPQGGATFRLRLPVGENA